MSKIVITFITHDVYLTGAPKLLLNLISLLKKTDEYYIALIIKEDKRDRENLSRDFKQLVSETLVWKSEIKNGKLLKLRKLYHKYLQQKRDNKIQTLINKSDIIIANTITNGDFFDCFNFNKVRKCISYIHELEIATEFFTNPKHLSVLVKKTDFYLVPSYAVANHLIKNLSIPNDKISLLNYYIPYQKNDSLKSLDDEIFYIGILGTLDWRKGADILPVFIKSFFEKYPYKNIKFIWKGVNINTIQYKRIKYELDKINLSDQVIFETASLNTQDFFNKIKLHLSLAKEDPYPLVVLEAASYHIPSLCFHGAGGAQEFIKNDAGATVPYLDLELLTEKIIYYKENENALVASGKNAFEKFLNLHYQEKIILQQFKNAINYK
ncbi:glycosyltransferase [Pedobacter glucosidilyticus]|uniref:glycosyltransferase n=1 Tax=Pedobacter glucosidilyticus TaxID=1122941 RepID=UPI0026E95BB7|nr:glycosyltransferase [Pedobacter glucosidilyticus]